MGPAQKLRAPPRKGGSGILTALSKSFEPLSFIRFWKNDCIIGIKTWMRSGIHQNLIEIGSKGTGRGWYPPECLRKIFTYLSRFSPPPPSGGPVLESSNKEQ